MGPKYLSQNARTVEITGVTGLLEGTRNTLSPISAGLWAWAGRNGNIRTTMSVYGDVITNAESEALAKIARLALANSTQTARGTA